MVPFSGALQLREKKTASQAERALGDGVMQSAGAPLKPHALSVL